jgi:hypothetical protein
MRPETIALVGGAFVVAVAIAASVLAIDGIDTDSLTQALQLTARFSFAVFWCAYAGSSLAAVLGMRFRLGRDCGLAFAAAHTVHLALVIWLYQVSSAAPLSVRAAVFFSIGLTWTYLLAVLSVEKLSKFVGATAWRWLRLIGLEYIMLAFQADFFPRAVHTGNLRHLLAYVPFAALGLAGTALRMWGWIHKSAPRILRLHAHTAERSIRRL